MHQTVTVFFILVFAIMASVSEFFETPTLAFINKSKKAQLLEIIDHYGIVVEGKNPKDELREAVLVSLFEGGILHKAELGVESQPTLAAPAVAPPTGLTFEQQKELLALQFDLEKLRRAEKLELEKMRQDTERKKLELEQTRKASSFLRALV